MSEGVDQNVEAFGGYVLGLVAGFCAGGITVFFLQVLLSLELSAALVVAAGVVLALVARSRPLGARLRFPLYGLVTGLIGAGPLMAFAVSDFASHTA